MCHLDTFSFAEPISTTTRGLKVCQKEIHSDEKGTQDTPEPIHVPHTLQ